MTTYLFNTVKIERNDDTVDVLSNITLEIVFPDAAGYTWSFDNPFSGRPPIDPDDESGGINAIEYYTGIFTPDAYDAREGDGFRLFGRDIDLGAFELEWGEGNSTAFLLLYDIDADTDYFIWLGGDAVPAFADIDAFDTWVDTQLNGLYPVTASTPGFAPDTAWDLSTVITLGDMSEDDYIEDVTGTDAFDTGLGADTLLPLWGDDVVDMGDEGGDDDWDTLDYSIDHLFTDEDGGLGPQQGITAFLINGTLEVEDSWGYSDVATGVDQLHGTQMADFVETDGSQTFFRFRGFEGADTFVGHARNFDSLDYRADHWFGGDGNIFVDFSGAIWTVNDGFGDIDTVSSVDEVRGTEQADYFYAGANDVRLRGEGGNDIFWGGAGGAGVFWGGDGHDYLDYSLLAGGAGINLSVSQALVKGGAGRDTFQDIEVIVGSSYRDVMNGSTEADILVGGAGNDVMRGRGGADQLTGGAGDDTLIAGKGQFAETFRGSEGDDIIRAFGGDDVALGGDDNDILRMGSGEDQAFGDAGADRIFGQGGDDLLKGGADDDYIEGGNGRDTIEGGTGADVLRGDGSLDSLAGGDDDDTLYGGAGRDTFIFENRDEAGRDVIKDWEDGLDQLDLTDFGFTDFTTEVLALATNVGAANMRIDFSDSNKIVIENFRVEDFDVSDVILTA